MCVNSRLYRIRRSENNNPWLLLLILSLVLCYNTSIFRTQVVGKKSRERGSNEVGKHDWSPKSVIYLLSRQVMSQRDIHKSHFKSAPLSTTQLLAKRNLWWAWKWFHFLLCPRQNCRWIKKGRGRIMLPFFLPYAAAVRGVTKSKTVYQTKWQSWLPVPPTFATEQSTLWWTHRHHQEFLRISGWDWIAKQH